MAVLWFNQKVVLLWLWNSNHTLFLLIRFLIYIFWIVKVGLVLSQNEPSGEQASEFMTASHYAVVFRLLFMEPYDASVFKNVWVGLNFKYKITTTPKSFIIRLFLCRPCGIVLFSLLRCIWTLLLIRHWWERLYWLWRHRPFRKTFSYLLMINFHLWEHKLIISSWLRL